MLTLNLNYYTHPDHAPQLHTGMADFLPDPNGGGEDPLEPPGMDSVYRSSLPDVTLGIGWATAPNPGDSGTSRELLAAWSGLPGTFPQDAADLRFPFPARARDRAVSQTLFASMGAFQDAVADLQTALNRDIPCWDATGVRHADLNTNYTNGSDGCETRDIFRESDNSLVGEAFIFRKSSTQTEQHWVIFNTERFDDVRVVRRNTGGYTSLSAFFTELAGRKPNGVSWPHAVETVTHYLSCPW
ncbi:hypothetical protein L6R46_05785 [Myxococcota bacterium]|nr:hypothetical protein [Myxococcota bacterium]